MLLRRLLLRSTNLAIREPEPPVAQPLPDPPPTTRFPRQSPFDEHEAEPIPGLVEDTLVVNWTVKAVTSRARLYALETWLRDFTTRRFARWLGPPASLT